MDISRISCGYLRNILWIPQGYRKKIPEMYYEYPQRIIIVNLRNCGIFIKNYVFVEYSQIIPLQYSIVIFDEIDGCYEEKHS